MCIRRVAVVSGSIWESASISCCGMNLQASFLWIACKLLMIPSCGQVYGSCITGLKLMPCQSFYGSIIFTVIFVLFSSRFLIIIDWPTERLMQAISNINPFSFLRFLIIYAYLLRENFRNLMNGNGVTFILSHIYAHRMAIACLSLRILINILQTEGHRYWIEIRT